MTPEQAAEMLRLLHDMREMQKLQLDLTLWLVWMFRFAFVGGVLWGFVQLVRYGAKA